MLGRASANEHRRGPSTARLRRFAQDDGFCGGVKTSGWVCKKSKKSQALSGARDKTWRDTALDGELSKDPRNAYFACTDRTRLSLGPRIKSASIRAMHGGYIYILGSQTGTHYIGVTSNLYLRVMQHKEGILEGFTAAYGCTRLLYFEGYQDISTAIAREKQLKGWRRERKLSLIRTMNPECKHLAHNWGWKMISAQEKMSP
jgi:putative endonuclease